MNEKSHGGKLAKYWYCKQTIRGCDLIADDERTSANDMFSDSRADLERYEQTAAVLNDELKQW